MWLWNIFKNKANKRDSLCRLREASFQDIEFITGMVIEGAKNEHYSKNYLLPNGVEMLKAFLLTIISGKVPTVFGDNGIEKKYGTLWIYFNKRLGNLGFVYLTEKSGGSWDSEREIMMFSIHDKFRGRGFGNGLLNFIMSGCPRHMKVYARCHKASKIMLVMLQKFGFNEIKTKSKNITTLVYEKGS